MVKLTVSLAVVVVAVVLWRRVIRDVPARYRSLVDAAEVTTLGVLVAMFAALAIQNMRSPGPWDFPVFYTVGRNAILGTSFYDPAALLPTFTAIQEAYAVPDDWLGQFGFWYAPPTALVLAPVGLPSYTAGLGVHYLMQFGFMIGTIWVLHRFLPLRPGPMGLVEIGILVTAFRPVADAVSLAQIVFGAVFAVAVALVAIRDRPVIAGVALGIGTLFKHLLVIPALLVVVFGRTRVAVAALVTILAASVIAAIAFGLSAYEEFISFGPSDRPPDLALDAEIESLNGFLRRLFDAVPDGSGAIDAILYPPYVLVAGAMTVVTVLVLWRARSTQEAAGMAFALALVLALIVYPNTLFNTLPILVPIIVAAASAANRLTFTPATTLVVLVSSYGLVLSRAIPGVAVMTLLWGYLAIELIRSSSVVRGESLEAVVS